MTCDKTRRYVSNIFGAFPPKLSDMIRFGHSISPIDPHNERMDPMRAELRKRIGTVEIAVDLIRDARNIGHLGHVGNVK